MSVIKHLINKIENSTGYEQERWVSIYNEYISNKLTKYLLENYKESNPLVTSENGVIKYTEYTKEERIKIIKEMETNISKIDNMFKI